MSGLNPKDLVGAKKAPLTLVPASAVIAMAAAMGNGAAKYGPYNWRSQPIQVRTYIEAALRHLYAYLDGQEAAEDTGISHLAHALASIAILYDANAMGLVDDNRVKGPAADLLRAQDKSVVPSEPVLIEDRFIVRVMGCKVQDALGCSNHWRMHEEPIHDEGSDAPDLDVTMRGVWPPDTRVAGYLTCCGQSEHPLDCANYR